MKYIKISAFSIKIGFISLLLILISPNLRSQSDFSIGAYVGSGYISGNSPNQTSLNSSVFLQMKTFLSDAFFLRFSFIYHRDLDYYVGTRNSYYPFIKGVTVKGIAVQELTNNLFFEEGFGFLYLNDRVFSNTVADDLGTVFSLAGGTDLSKYTNIKVKLGLGFEYGLTFNNTLADYLSVHLQGEYSF
jgi:hypothetical protein